MAESDALDNDPIAENVDQWVRSIGDGTTSLLMNRFLIGYNRASWLLKKLEDRGVIERYTDEGDWSFRFRLTGKGTSASRDARATESGVP